MDINIIAAEEKERREQEKEKARAAKKEEANSLDLNVIFDFNDVNITNSFVLQCPFLSEIRNRNRRRQKGFDYS